MACFFLIHQKIVDLILTIAQKFFTPDEHDENVYVKDHPYAGWLFFKIKYNKLLLKNLLSSAALSLGVVGSRSKAEYLQNKVHKLIGANEYKGWNYQVPDQKSYIAQYMLSYLIPFYVL